MSPETSDGNPQSARESGIPLVSVEGTAYECGCRYGRIVADRYPGYRKYPDMAFDWPGLPREVRQLVERRAGYLVDLYRGLADTVGPPVANGGGGEPGGCTSFGVSGSLTADGRPLSGQTKDTAADSARWYIVLQMRIVDGPAILVLAYPGEVLGYGLWSTGMSLFRNDLFSSAGAERGLTMVQWGLLALAAGTVPQAVELAEQFGISGCGNCLITDRAGEAVSVEFNRGGLSVVPAGDGMAIHANHPEGPQTSLFERYPEATETEHSRLRARRLRQLLAQQQGRLTPAAALAALADHEHHPHGICRHVTGQAPGERTTAALVAEPAAGKLHVVNGQPCCNEPTTYSIRLREATQ